MGPKRNKAKIQVHDKTSEGRSSRKSSSVDHRKTVPIENPGYTCTGHFATDFTYFCREQHLPYVPPVVARSTAASVQELGLATGWDLACPPDTSLSLIGLESFRGGRSNLLGKKLRLKPSLEKAKRDNRFQKESSKMKMSVDFMPARRKEVTSGAAAKSRETSADLLIEGDLEDVAGGYSTFREGHKYFIPVIQAAFVKGDMDQGNVTDLYIRDWKVDVAMMAALAPAMAASQHLRSLYCWNTSLDASTLSLLTKCLQHCHILTQLTLDNNPLIDLSVSALLGEDSRLQQLSLRFCQLTDLNATGIGAALGTTYKANRTLRHLNLANNRLGDAGAQALARGLMTNRTLLTLNLAGNHIGNPGAEALAEALADFPLDPEQMQERRRQEFARLEDVLRRQSSVPAAASVSKRLPVTNTLDAKSKSPSGGHFDTHKVKTKTKTSKGGEKEFKSATHGKDNVNKSHSDRVQNTKERRSSVNAKRGKSVKQLVSPYLALTAPISHAALEQCHPLSEAGLLIGGRLYVVGNRTLLSLNLSRNSIGETGLVSLWQMVQAQSRLDPAGPGLLRLALERNSFHRDHEYLRLLRRHLSLREEAHFHPQPPPTPDPAHQVLEIPNPDDKRQTSPIISRSDAPVV